MQGQGAWVGGSWGRGGALFERRPSEEDVGMVSFLDMP
jgi:hypothetical protein